jgi:hypothetical protein
MKSKAGRKREAGGLETEEKVEIRGVIKGNARRILIESPPRTYLCNLSGSERFLATCRTSSRGTMDEGFRPGTRGEGNVRDPGKTSVLLSDLVYY